jgi:hypothetical protein
MEETPTPDQREKGLIVFDPVEGGHRRKRKDGKSGQADPVSSVVFRFIECMTMVIASSARPVHGTRAVRWRQSGGQFEKVMRPGSEDDELWVEVRCTE